MAFLAAAVLEPLPAAMPVVKLAQQQPAAPTQASEAMRASLFRPADFARLTEALKRKQALLPDLDESAVRAEFEKRALAGDTEAALTLGLMLRYGEGASDKAAGEKLIAAAAESGHARAMAELGRLLLADEGRADGPAQAEAWLRKAGAAGESEGAFLLASAQRLGILDPRDGEDPTRILVTAAEQGNASAQRLMLLLYLQGEDGATKGQIWAWTEMQAERGDTEAMVMRAKMSLADGDQTGGVRWLERAATAGSAAAVLGLVDIALRDGADAEVFEMARRHLRAILAEPATATAEARFALALVELSRAQDGAARQGPIALLHEAAEGGYYRAGLFAFAIEDGMNWRQALAAVERADLLAAREEYLAERRRRSANVDDNSGSAGELPARVVSAPYIPFPDELKAARSSGTVVLECEIDSDGSINHVVVISSDHPAFSAAAIAGLQETKLEPARKGGRPVRSRLRIPVDFKLPR